MSKNEGAEQRGNRWWSKIRNKEKKGNYYGGIIGRWRALTL